jgi:hypothetical protein
MNAAGKSAMVADPKRARRILDVTGAVAAVVAILGLIFARQLIVLWSFLLLFGITTVPERFLSYLRQRRRVRRARDQ